MRTSAWEEDINVASVATNSSLLRPSSNTSSATLSYVRMSVNTVMLALLQDNLSSSISALINRNARMYVANVAIHSADLKTSVSMATQTVRVQRASILLEPRLQ
jgi:hypothetical protein